MMKKIAVLIHSLTVEYAIDVLSGISDYFKDKDVQLIVSQVKLPHCKKGLYDYQHWSSTSILFSEQVDGIIVVTGSFTFAVSAEVLTEFLKQFPSKPMISIGQKLDLPDCLYTTTECGDAYDEVISHLKNKHGCKKISFMSAHVTGSIEAIERYEAFKAAMKKNDLDFDESQVMNGNFTSSSAHKILSERYKFKEDINFDAIVCANDLMAIGCMTFLKDLGVKIPEEVKVVGFDGTSNCMISEPKLSTIDQQVSEQGRLAAKLILDRVEGRKIEKENIISVKPAYRQSCGCIPLTETNNVFMDNKDKVTQCEVSKIGYTKTGIPMDFLNQMVTVGNVFDLVTSATTVRRYAYKVKYIMEPAEISKLAIYLYDSPFDFANDTDFELPEKMNMTIYSDLDSGRLEIEPGVSFNPHKTIMPEKSFPAERGIFLLQPVYSGETNYGYIISKINNLNFPLYNVYHRIIIGGICQSYEYTASIMENDKLSQQNKILEDDNNTLALQSKTDELTKLFNRRGFMEFAQRTIDIAIEMGNTGLVLFGDLDNLKKINDDFGHDMGDAAIKTLAEILKETFRANDILGRLSGDEFVIVAVGLNHDVYDGLHAKVDRLCAGYAKQRGFHFNFSCSMGAVEFNKAHASLTELIAVADERMYIEKRNKHSKALNMLR